MSARDELQMTIFRSNRLNTQVDLQSDRRLEGSQLAWAGYAASAVRAAGYRKPRIITTAKEANELPDRSAILTPGEIIFRKWENYYETGKHAWERELGQMVPAELLSDSAHFPATVLHEPEATK